MNTLHLLYRESSVSSFPFRGGPIPYDNAGMFGHKSLSMLSTCASPLEVAAD